MVDFILGGARSGKSSFAKNLAKQKCIQKGASGLHYVATAIAFDDEMAQRIRHHQQMRGAEWQQHEAPYYLIETLQQFSAGDVVLVDCLILWLNNIIFEHGSVRDYHQIEMQLMQLIDVIQNSPATIILVSNEVGMGVIPEGELSQLFADLTGMMNQRVTEVASHVILVAAGIPVSIKGSIDITELR